MGRIDMMNHVALDGVLQGPGRPDEDIRGGFTHGGWGRRTYEELLATWNARGGPFKEALNITPKYVVSSTLQEPLLWPNSTLLRGDMADAVRTLKAESSGVLAIMGSGELIGSLMAADLIDEYLLMIHPLALGSGRRLVPDNVHMQLRLIGSTTTPTGVVIATYEPAGG